MSTTGHPGLQPGEQYEQAGMLVAKATEEAAAASPNAPFGFAAADAPPLDPTESSPRMNVPGNLGTPQRLDPPAQPGPNLAALAPAPPAVRDPRQPFEQISSGLTTESTGEWDPRTPLTTSADAIDSRGTTGWSAITQQLPAPTGQPVVATGPAQSRQGPAQFPQRALPATQPPLAPQARPINSPYPSNPYASGLYVPPAPQRQRPLPPGMQQRPTRPQPGQGQSLNFPPPRPR